MKEIYLPVTKSKYLFFLLAFIVSIGCCLESVAQTQQVFTTAGAGTFTIPAGVTQVTVECWGGGGNGGSTNTNGNKTGGGGGGAYARKLLTVIPGNTYNLTVGAAGNDSWFNNNTIVLAKGGTSVVANATGGGAGGSAVLSIGDQVYSGGNGGSASNAGTGNTGGGGSSAGNSANGNNAVGATAGAAPGGGGAGGAGLVGNNGNGNPGNNPGGGGSGGWRQGSGGGLGAGAVGKVVISYYLLTGTSIPATICQNTTATVTLSGTAVNLPVGTYTVTYNITGANTAVGNTATMTVSSAGTGTFTTTSLVNTGSTTVTVTKLASGFYASSVGSNNTATFTVSSPAQPTVTAGGPTTFCTGGSVLLTSSAGTTYKWYSDGVLIPSATSQTYTATASAVYTVVITNASGCTSVPSAGTTVTVNSLPATPSITADGPTTLCADGTLILSSTAATGYQWYKGGVLIPGAINQDYSPTTSGSYTVTVSNANGCVSAQSSGVSVTVNPLPAIPTISASPSTGVVCAGSNVVLTSSAATTYQWYELSGIIGGATAINYSANATGSYYVKVTNGFGCVATSAVKDVTVNPLPDITIASQATGVCGSASAQTTQLAFTNIDNSPITYSITWNAVAQGAGFAAISDAALPIAPTPISISIPANAPANTYTGTLTVKNANGCESSSKTFTVTVASTPNISDFSITAANGCVGTGAVITVNSTSLADGVYNVIYDLGGSFNNATNNTAVLTFSGNSGTFTAAALNAGLTTITVKEIALVGCSSTVNSTANFTINALPAVPTISGANEVCVDAAITLIGNPLSGTWSSASPSIASVDNATGVVSGLIGGVATITYTTTPVNGCTNSNTLDVTVNALPTVQPITGQTSYCVGSGATLSNATPNGTWSSSNNSIATIDNAGVVDALAVGNAVITYTTEANAVGCFNIASANIVVNADPTVVAGADENVCESSSPAQITLAGASFGGGASGAFWTIENSGSGTLSAQGSGNNPGNIKYTPAANFYGTITLKLTTTAVGTCGTTSATRLINITQKPTVTPGSPITVCQSASPSAITLSTAAVGGSATNGTWSIVSGGGTLSDVTPVTDPANVTYTPAANASGAVTLRLTTDAVGVCGTTSADRVINITALPVAIGGAQNSVCQSATPGAITLIGAGISGGANTGTWTIAQGSGTLSNPNPTATPGNVTFTPAVNFAGTVKLTLTTDAPGGCSATTAERIIDVTPASTVLVGGPDIVCQSATPGAITLTGAGVGGGATTGTWTVATGTLSSTNPETDPSSVTYTPAANYSGTVSLLLTTNATGNCPAVSAVRTITVNPNATITLTSAAATTTQTPCINTAITAITYSVGGGATGATVIGLPAGVNPSFSAGVLTISGTPTVAGPFSYTVTTTGGTCTPGTATGTINVSALTVGGTISPASSSPLTVCSGTNSGILTLSGNTGSVVRWEQSTNGGASWNNITNTNTTQPYSNLTQTTLYRALVQSGVCGSTYSALGQIVVLQPFTPNISPAGPLSTCLGVPVTLKASGYGTSGLVIANGDFSNVSPGGWYGMNGNASNNSGNGSQIWGVTNNSDTYYGVTYSSPGGRYMITSGAISSTLTTPSFSTVGMSSAVLVFNEGYTFAAGTIASIEITTNAVGAGPWAAATWTTLKSYTVPGTSPGSKNPMALAAGIDLNAYLGLSNLAIRFRYQGAGNSVWALDNVVVTNSIANPTGQNAYNPLKYTWSPTTYLSSPNTSTTVDSVIVTPTAAGSQTYTVSAAVGSCAVSTPSAGVLITFNPNPVITNMTTTTCSGTAFTAAPVDGTNGIVPTGTTYTWTVSAPAGISGASAQAVAQTSISQTLTNTTTTAQTVVYTVTPKTATCTGSTFTVTVTLNPKSAITAMTAAACSGSAFTVTPVNGTNGLVVPGTTYSWAAPALTGGMTGGASGAGASSISGTLTNAASVTAQTGTYNVTPLSGTCTGTSFTVTATISPATVPGSTLPATLAVCTVGSNTLTLSGSVGSIVRWESSTNNGASWTPIANTTTTLNANVVAATTLYRVVVQSGVCPADTSSIAKAGLKNYWIGAVSTDWQDGNNWSAGAVPIADLSCPTVTIPTGAPRMPTLSTGTSVIINLDIQSAASATITGTGLLTIGGTITKAATGTFDVSNGSLEFKSSSGQTISGSLFVGNNIKNLRVSNTNASGLSLTGGVPLNILGDLDFGASNSTLTTNDNLVLRSTATTTARIADITNGGLYTGNKFIGKVTVERYFPADRSWRLLTSPLTNTGNIFGSWQNNRSFAAATGMLVTGPTPNPPVNGLDSSAQNNYSMYTWDVVAQKYIGVGNTRTMLLSGTATSAANKGFFTFVRGDRSPANTIIPNTNITTLSSTGFLQTGTQTFTASPLADSFTLVGNPYASPVDMAAITRNNVAPRFIVWDPKLSDVGAYVTMEESSPGVYTPNPIRLGGQDNYIQSSQAFFVQTVSTAAASVIFNETNKSDQNRLGLFRPAAPAERRSLSIYLYKYRPNNEPYQADGTYVQFDNSFAKRVDISDALKFSNINETFGILRDDKFLAIEKRPEVVDNDTVFLKLTKTTRRKYHFEILPQKISKENLTAFIEDQFLKTKTPLNLESQTDVDFEVNADAASAAADRFKIVFRPSAIYTDIDAKVVNGDIAVNWSVSSEFNIQQYEVERSVDGTNFTKLNEQPAAKNDFTSAVYNSLDASPAIGTYYYRIKSISNTGVIGYSNTVKVKINKSTPAMYVLPNPVTNNIIQVQMNSLPAGVYDARLLTSTGQLVFADIISHAPGTATETLLPKKKLTAGIYQLKITAPDKKVTIIKVAVE